MNPLDFETDRSVFTVCADVGLHADSPGSIRSIYTELRREAERIAISQGIELYDIEFSPRRYGNGSNALQIVAKLIPRPLGYQPIESEYLGLPDDCECGCRGSARTLEWTPRDLPGYPVSAGLPGHTSADSARWTPPEDNDSTDRDIDDLLSDISQLLREETELSDESGKQGKQK